MAPTDLKTNKVLLTGATSFTGAYIAKDLVASGYNVYATLTKPVNAYQESLVKDRMSLASGVEWLPESPVGSESLLETIKTIKPTVFINHGASISGYRNPDFDYLQSVSLATKGLEKLLGTLKDSGCSKIIHSGSVFEPDEGHLGGEAVSIYGVSKNLTWQVWRFFSQKISLPISKIVIPNPIGPFENLDRLGPLFVKKWKMGESPVLTTPALVRDHVPASWLSKVYLEEVGNKSLGVKIRRPSAFKLSNLDFVSQFSAYCKKYLDLKSDFSVTPKPTSEPIYKINSENCPELLSPSEIDKFWSTYFIWLGGLK